MANITSGAKLFPYGELSVSPPSPFRFAPAGGSPIWAGRMLQGELSTLVNLPGLTSPFPGGSTPISTEKTGGVEFYFNYHGNYKVIGLVEINTVVVAGKWVYIFPEDAPSLCIGAQYTTSSGAFSFLNLAAGKYKVYAMDPNFSYNGKLYENITAVSM